MPSLSREQFGKPAQLPREQFEVAELGGYVVLRSLSVKEVNDLRTAKTDPQVPDVLAVCLLDDNGQQLFKDGADLVANFNATPATMQAMFDKVASLSGTKGDAKN